ncbi:hypothetical protein GOP47_0025667 [Adiantum capillus-veneris]|uniref:Uncharacterized protein n=1 Tax=Adiantum capillus-veneris TaxID=13818 RepID=A0A9D4Z2E2_ADICA|nr:hypothetical protein GOP47_0025667 [Adiantum capillus-veneris]
MCEGKDCLSRTVGERSATVSKQIASLGLWERDVGGVALQQRVFGPWGRGEGTCLTFEGERGITKGERAECGGIGGRELRREHGQEDKGLLWKPWTIERHSGKQDVEDWTLDVALRGGASTIADQGVRQATYFVPYVSHATTQEESDSYFKEEASLERVPKVAMHEEQVVASSKVHSAEQEVKLDIETVEPIHEKDEDSEAKFEVDFHAKVPDYEDIGKEGDMLSTSELGEDKIES